VFVAEPDISDGDLQDLQVKNVQLAVLPFTLKTSLREQVEVSILGSTENMQPDDPWNYWVFRISGGGFFNGQESASFLNFNTRLSANRVTDLNKLEMRGSFSYEQERFTLTDEEFVSITRSGRFNGLYVYSISDHWSVGGFLNSFSSTFRNIDFAASLRPGIEYNLYPYSEATKRQFTIQYRIGGGYTNYADMTIFDKTDQWTARQDLEISYRLIEAWGSLDLELDFGNYLHDFALLSVSFEPQLEWNVFKGFSINLGGFISLVRDQVNIRKSSASDEEILLQIRQLKTDYRYFGHLGVSYRFGSQYNNIVNTRF